MTALRLASSAAATAGVCAASYFSYTRGVRTVASPGDTPPGFQALLRARTAAASQRPVTWGFYHVRTDAADASGAQKHAALTRLARLVFASSFYAPERVLSGASEDPLRIQCAKGETFGNMECIDRRVNETTWQYTLPGFNFCMFFGTYGNVRGIGFVDVNGDLFEDGGSRFLLPLLLKDASTQLERGCPQKEDERAFGTQFGSSTHSA
ncbi:hypothetical protein BDR26DRAFT_416402 [Obelidium mucronatum]|nr:hypothetical protein BDR26DRAFT_416402 [Obelidium mucronatum]